MRTLALLAVIAAAVGLIAYAALSDDDAPSQTTNPSGSPTKPPPAVEFVSPLDGATVSNPIDVRMAVGGVLLVPASELPSLSSGHLHVIIDGQPPKREEMIPTDPTHLHLDDGGFAITLPELTTGPHTLTAVFTPNTNILVAETFVNTIQITVTE